MVTQVATLLLIQQVIDQSVKWAHAILQDSATHLHDTAEMNFKKSTWEIKDVGREITYY